MSDRVERKIVALLGEHRESPYGNPIPGLDELLGEGDPDDEDEFREGLHTLVEVVDGGLDSPFVVRRLGEPVQVDEDALPLLTQANVRPGARVDVRADGERVIIVREGGGDSEGVSLPRDVAVHVFVAQA